ncbi:MAG: hypothetical protein M1460_02185 [Candidatus Thermoplasmatota archaeon]|jgi:hypothetical protein|nr:hypothetical protein [Candidatus Thermoplasmatota archaeon]
MDKVSPTRSQINFITKLREGSGERENFIQKFLEEKAKDNISQLSVPEASSLIDSLKKIKSEGSASEGGVKTATPKQIKFIKALQNSSEKLEKSISYLKNIGKDDISELTVKEASGLIELLKG